MNRIILSALLFCWISASRSDTSLSEGSFVQTTIGFGNCTPCGKDEHPGDENPCFNCPLGHYPQEASASTQNCMICEPGLIKVGDGYEEGSICTTKNNEHGCFPNLLSVSTNNEKQQQSWKKSLVIKPRDANTVKILLVKRIYDEETTELSSQMIKYIT